MLEWKSISMNYLKILYDRTKHIKTFFLKSSLFISIVGNIIHKKGFLKVSWFENKERCES